MSKKISSIGNYADLYYKTKIHNRFLIETGQLKKKKKDKIKIIESKKRIVNFKEKVRPVTKPMVTNEEILYRKLLDNRQKYKDEIRVHGEQTLIKEGFVYLIENESFPGWVKVGMAFDYEKRLSVYNQYDPEKRYAIVGLRWVTDRRKMESFIIDKMNLSTLKRVGEWFKIDVTTSLNIFYSVNE